LTLRTHKKIGKVSTRIRSVEQQYETLRLAIDNAKEGNDDEEEKLLQQLEQAPDINIHKVELDELQSRLKKLNYLEEQYTKLPLLKKSKQLLPVIILISSVIGSIYTGVATATEAASLGVVGALILSYFQKSLTIETFKQSLLGATKTSCMIAFILAGSTFLSLAMGFTGLPRNLAIWIQNMELSPYVLIFVLMIFYIILGMFLDGISAVVLTMAIIEPMIRQAGFDMIWFGIFLVIVVEMAQITPPVGFNLFVLQGMANKDMGFIARSAFPLFLLMILAVILVVIFPEIALWMPQQMVQNIN